MPNSESLPIKNFQEVSPAASSRVSVEYTNFPQFEIWQRKLILGLLLLAVAASFIAYAHRSVDFVFYAAEGNAFFEGKDIYLDTPHYSNTMPPFFSLVAVPLALLNHVSVLLNHILWVALNWAACFWAMDLIARMIYSKRLRFHLQPDESSLTLTSPELLVPFLFALPFTINNFELLQINIILFTVALWGLYLQSEGKNAAGGVLLAVAAATKVMAIVFLPYLVYRKRWRAAFWMATATAVFSLSPAIFIGWGHFVKDVGYWREALNATMGSGNSLQSVYSMWDRILGYGYIPFAVPGTFILPFSGSHAAKLAWEISCVVVGLASLYAFGRAPLPNSRWAQIEWSVVFVAGTILSPLTRKPYLVVLLLPYALLYGSWHASDVDWHTRRVLRYIVYACFAMSIPTLHDVIGKALAVRLEMGSIVTYGTLIMLGGLLWYRTRAPRES